MTPGRQIEGVATYGRPRTTRPVRYTRRPTRCPVCLTNQHTGRCPADCPTQTEEDR